MEQMVLLAGEAQEVVEARRAANRAQRAAEAEKAKARVVTADRSQIEHGRWIWTD